jgi:thiamine biosynthesis lipoprotein
MSRTSRRDFLTGTSAAEALADALAGPPPPLPPPKTGGVEPGTHLLSVSREAMACLFEVVYDAARYRHCTELAVEALELVARLEDQLTVYRETSEVSALNRRAAQEPVAVESRLFELLARAVELARETEGAFDITSGRLSQVWGFYRRQGRMPSKEEVTEALATVGSRHLELCSADRTVRFRQPGLALNLGAIGKGYALDRTGEFLVEGGLADFLLHGGNSSVLARGTRQPAGAEADAPAARGWSVALRHPLQPNQRLVEFVLMNQALGTSGSGTQYFHYQGRRYGHILDPRSGWPAEGVLSATVIAPTAEQADALSTALYVLGWDGARDFCARRPEIAALLVTQRPGAGGIELHPLNLADSAWRLIDERQ